MSHPLRGRANAPDLEVIETSRRDLVLALVVPVVVAALAVVGVWRFHAVDQASWRGGSYGMFATYEQVDTRTVRAFDADGELLPLPALPEEDLERVLVAPDPDRLDDLLDAARALDPDIAALTVYGRVVETDDGDTVVSLRPIRTAQR